MSPPSTPTLRDGSTSSAIVPSEPAVENIAALHLLKTKPCIHYQHGTCRYGSKCHFAHSPEELRPEVDLKKTSLCKDFLAHKCPRSAKDCPFAHGKRELRCILPQEMLDAIKAQKAAKKAAKSKRTQGKDRLTEGLGLEAQRHPSEETRRSSEPNVPGSESSPGGTSGDQEWRPSTLRVIPAGPHERLLPALSTLRWREEPAPTCSMLCRAGASEAGTKSEGSSGPSSSLCSPWGSEGSDGSDGSDGGEATGCPWVNEGNVAGAYPLEHRPTAILAVQMRRPSARQALPNRPSYVLLGNTEAVLKQDVPAFRRVTGQI